MIYPDLRNLKNSKRVGANLYDMSEEDIPGAAKEFEKAGLIITGITKHKEEYNHIFYFVTVEPEERVK